MELAASPDVRPAGAGGAGRDIARVRAPLGGASLSRAEIALRKTTQDWAMACNTKQLDDLVDLYVPDATVLRPNVPAVRGAAAIREFFFGLLDAGMSEVEMDSQRAELLGDYGYETGRCKSLVPSAVGKRREERGKYLVDVQSVSKVQGVSFLADEIGRVIRAALGGTLAEVEQDKTMVAKLTAALIGAGAQE